jgi:hypothetical protein
MRTDIIGNRKQQLALRKPISSDAASATVKTDGRMGVNFGVDSYPMKNNML